MRHPVPLARLERATCCLGDNCQSSAQTAPVGSRQLRLGGDSGECGLVGCSRAWWNDRQNDQQCKLGGSRGMDGVDLNVGLLSVWRSRVVEQMTHGGTVAKPCDRARSATLIWVQRF